jgi:membrane associated rhomboid family serine protease
MSYTLLIIGITSLATVIAWSNPKWQNDGMMFPYRVWHLREWHTLVTSALLHANGTHLLFNMITLFFFGPSLERILGPSLYLTLYIVSMIVAGIPSVIRHKDNPNYATLGASGAVSAVLFSYILYMPLSKIYLFFIPIGIPAALFGFMYLAYTFWESRRGHGTINHDAHLAGAIIGIVLTFIMDPMSVQIFLHAIGIMQ